MTKSKKRPKRTKNLTSKLYKKYLLFFPHAFRSLLCIRFVTVVFQSEEAVLWRRDPSLTYFCPTLDHTCEPVASKKLENFARESLAKKLENFVRHRHTDNLDKIMQK